MSSSSPSWIPPSSLTFSRPIASASPALGRPRHLERVTVAVQPQEKASPAAAHSLGRRHRKRGTVVGVRQAASMDKKYLSLAKYLCVKRGRVSLLSFILDNAVTVLTLYPNTSICAGYAVGMCVHSHIWSFYYQHPEHKSVNFYLETRFAKKKE